MAISSSVDFTVSTFDIVREAYELLGAISMGQDPDPAQVKSALRTLNMMTKTWQADGLNLFAVQEAYLFLQKTQQKYTLSGSTTDHFTTSFTETTTSAAAVATATQVVLTSATGIAVGDYIGVKEDTGEDVFWTTVSGIGSSPTIDIDDALTEGVDSGATVYYYTSKANRPMKVLEAYLVQNSSTTPTDIPCEVVARKGYSELSQKSSSGLVNQVYFDPQVSSSSLHVWPVTDNERNYLRLFLQRTLSDFDCLQNTPDYPQEWYMALSYGLAVLLAPKIGTPDRVFNKVAAIAGELYKNASNWDQESETSLYFSPDNTGRSL